MTKRAVLAVLFIFPIVAFLSLPAFAGSPHFISCHIVGATPNSLTVAAKEAGLGDEEQILAELHVTAECVNRGGNKPSAGNKDEFMTSAVIPVQNGKANYTLTVMADFQPECSPPMSVVFSEIIVVDVTHGISCMP